MTSFAIIRYRPFTLFFDHNGLGFCPEGKNVGVAQAIHGLEHIFLYYIVLWNMTIITSGHFPMSTMHPGRILGTHDMTIHTGFRSIRKIRKKIGNMDNN